ncbi:MAG: hypothetical protein LBR22_11160 [Desulfovibrio sp.]|jgi:uncharacterized protein (DUF4415 family)|nr:hypothetical protein [Desulfovibrio sp.]
MMEGHIPSLEEQYALIDAIKDEDIDFSDIPEVHDTSGWVRGCILDELKMKNGRIRIDQDIVTLFGARYDDIHEAVNDALRSHIKTAH